MVGNSTTSIVAYSFDPATAITVIGFALGIFSFYMTSLFVYTAVVGLGAPDPTTPDPSPDWGKPWPLSITTGLDGRKENQSEELSGSEGPFPEVHLFNDNGDYLGGSRNGHDHVYVGHNKVVALKVFPNNVLRDEGQYATFVILEDQVDGRDPLCVVDLGLVYPDALGEAGSTAFNAFTARSCGAPWYHSGIYRKDADKNKITSPCFWFGGYGVKAMQVHLPSHTQLTADLPLGGMNSTAEASHDWFCNRPAALNFWGIIPGKGSHTLFEKDMNKRGTKTLNQTLEAHKGKGKSGKTSKPSRSLSSSQHEDTLTIAHELPAFGLSASELCDNALSMGPDFVNLPEGKFCRMSDKTLWPTCNYHSRDGERDNCFDVTSKKLVVGGKVTRNKPYSREMNFPLD